MLPRGLLELLCPHRHQVRRWYDYQNNLYFIPETKFKIKPYKLAVALYSISDRLISKFAEEVDIACAKLNLPCTVSRIPIKKSQLKTASYEDESDVAVIIHKNEGRLLLTDENGLYDSIIRQLITSKRILS